MAAEPEVERATDCSPRRAAIGWLTVLSNLAYTIYGYYGFAPPPGGMPTDWWHGRTYILDTEMMGGYVDAPLTGALVFGAPAVVLCLATLFTTRSAIARTLSLSLTLTSVLFAAAGFAAGPLWVLFSWRLTAIAFLMGLCLAAAALAPQLVASGLRLHWSKRVLLYLPFFFGSMAAVRGATGTSEQMAFMVSPWPLLTTFGLETGVLATTIFLFAIALGVLSVSRGRLDAIAIAGVLLAIALPGAFLALGVSELPSRWGLRASLIAAGLVVVCSMDRGDGGSRADRRARLLTRGYHVGLGAVLVALPIFAGRSLAEGDYALNRYLRAPSVIEALQQHIKAEEVYPETLGGLVEAGYFDQTPKPRIGFAVLETLGLADEVKYRYNEYGSSFVLEFDSSFWVQCSYSGNYYFEEDEAEFDEEDEEYANEEPQWTCLDKRPALIEEEGYEEDDDS